ncbi:MAG: GntR family transcriptional regulator [Mogibacterium sp.]|jgi:DNA-binding GntR family transcriptional regulator|nr:GntR family transcriptional regulator [Mogibacterium sp.]MBQ9076103.1 GntR family transcriptional regulator [Mogibacterium sp.]
MEINSAEKNSQPLSAGLYQEIQKDILSGVFESGSKLTEAAVCKRYSVSRTPVREAFRQLEADGLIENIPNRGAFVTGLTKRDISDLFDLRSLFEIQAVEWAIKRMDDDDIDVLRETVEFMEFYTLKDDIEKVLSFNSQFHNTIYAGTKDRMIQRTLSTYQTYLKHSAPAKTFTGGYLRTILEEHKAIFAAFENRNVAAGRKAMEYHMEQSKLRRIANYF